MKIRRATGDDNPLARLRVIGPEPDPSFRAALRERLVLAAASVDAVPVPAPRRGPNVLPAAAMALVLLLGGVFVAARNSLPGDQFYAVKRVSDSAQMMLATNDRERGDRALRTARARAKELAALLDRPGGGDPALVAATLDDMDGYTRTGSTALNRIFERTHDAEPMAALASFARDQRARLKPLLPRLPSVAAVEVRGSLTLICSIAERITLLARFGMIPPNVAP